MIPVRFVPSAALLGFLPLTAFATDPAAAPEIRTPAAPPTPRINGPRVYGFADLRSVSVRDLWRRKPLEIVGDKKPEITFHVAPHSAELLKISVHEAIF